ncbi:MAG: hypothetical protein R3E79_31820 [Caldilineaceae bacterium]
MALLSKADITAALQRLGELALQSGYEIELLAVGGTVMVLHYVEPYLTPGDELKASYAFLDLWETNDGEN